MDKTNHPDFVKDPVSGVVINTNRNQLTRVIAEREKVKQQKAFLGEIEVLKEKVACLTQRVEELEKK